MAQTFRSTIAGAGKSTIAGPSGKLYIHEDGVGGERVWADGTASGESDESSFANYTPAGASITAIDLTALAAVLPGGSGALSKVKGIIIDNSANSYEVYVGGGSGGHAAPNADAWSDSDAGVDGSPFLVDGDIITIPAGGRFAWEAPAGVAVPGATAKILGIEQGAGGAGDFDVELWGDA
jgi:hypothetical protein